MTKRRDILFSIAAAGMLAFAGTSANAAGIGSAHSSNLSPLGVHGQTDIQGGKLVHKAHHSKFRKHRKLKRHLRRHHRLNHVPRFYRFKHYGAPKRFTGKRHFHRPHRFHHRPKLHFRFRH